MLVLAVDTSTPAITAGVVELGGPGATPALLAERTRVDPFGHAEYLMPLVRDALAAAGRELPGLDAVVAGLGPGPFTGLRVGIATAAALADGLGVRVHGAPSHDAFAAGLDGVLVVTDARRREVHVSVHRGGGCVAGPQPLRPDAVARWLADAGIRPAAVTGAGAGLVADTLQLPVVPAAVATSVGLATAAALGSPPAPLVPLYLRRPDATEPSAPKAVLPL